MTDAVVLLGHVAAGLRIAVALLALGVILSLLTQPEGEGAASRTARLAWLAVAVATLVRSVPRAAMLTDFHPVTLLADRLTEIAATGLACAAFILLLAALARGRGVHPARVRNGIFANIGVVFAVVGATWLTQ